VWSFQLINSVVVLIDDLSRFPERFAACEIRGERASANPSGEAAYLRKREKLDLSKKRERERGGGGSSRERFIRILATSAAPPRDSAKCTRLIREIYIFQNVIRKAKCLLRENLNLTCFLYLCI